MGARLCSMEASRASEEVRFFRRWASGLKLPAVELRTVIDNEGLRLMSAKSLIAGLAIPTRIFVLSVVVLLLWAVTAVVCVSVIALVMQAPFSSTPTICSGILCSLIVWTFVITFHYRREKKEFDFHRRPVFTKQVREGLADLGYEVKQPSRYKLVGKPSFTAFLLGGAIQVEMNEKSATITGPKMSLEQLRRRLRVESHLDSNLRCLEDSGWYQQEGLLRSAQVHLRMTDGNPPQQICQELVDSLRRTGASVFCEINIYISNEKGIDEAVVEKLIEDKVNDTPMTVSVHKKPMMSELAAATTTSW